MSIDIEGAEFDALLGLSFDRYQIARLRLSTTSRRRSAMQFARFSKEEATCARVYGKSRIGTSIRRSPRGSRASLAIAPLLLAAWIPGVDPWGPVPPFLAVLTFILCNACEKIRPGTCGLIV